MQGGMWRGVLDVAWCGVVWCGVVWCVVVRCGAVRCVVWCGVVWCGDDVPVRCGVIWYGCRCGCGCDVGIDTAGDRSPPLHTTHQPTPPSRAFLHTVAIRQAVMRLRPGSDRDAALEVVHDARGACLVSHFLLERLRGADCTIDLLDGPKPSRRTTALLRLCHRLVPRARAIHLDLHGQ